MSLINQETHLSYLYQTSGVNSKSQFIFLLVLLVSNHAGSFLLLQSQCILFGKKPSMFANRIGVEISGSLYTYYLRQNWLFHTM